MKCNACLFHDEIEKSRNHLVLHYDKVYRLIGISKDDFDYYYMLKEASGKIRYMSCVMGWLDLIDILPEESYKRLDELFVMNENNCQNVDVMEDISNILKDDCWCEEKA